MKYFLIFLFTISSSAFAIIETTCELTVDKGIYQNSSNSIQNIKFITLTEIFSLINFKTLSLTLDGEEMVFPIRTEFDANERYTKMAFRLKEEGPSRAAHIVINGIPRDIRRSMQFDGYMLITPEIEDSENLMSVVQRQDILTYNFHCSF